MSCDASPVAMFLNEESKPVWMKGPNRDIKMKREKSLPAFLAILHVMTLNSLSSSLLLWTLLMAAITSSSPSFKSIFSSKSFSFLHPEHWWRAKLSDRAVKKLYALSSAPLSCSLSIPTRKEFEWTPFQSWGLSSLFLSVLLIQRSPLIVSSGWTALHPRSHILSSCLL